MSESKLPNIFITNTGEESIFNPNILGWDGLMLFKYLVRECWIHGKVALPDSDIERMFSIAEKRRAKIKQLFRDHLLVRIHSKQQKHNTTTYEVAFDNLANWPETLAAVYRHGNGGLKPDTLKALAEEYAKMAEVQQSKLAQYEAQPQTAELRAIVTEMNKRLGFWASNIRSQENPLWVADPFKLIADPTTLRKLKGALKHFTAQQILSAFNEFAKYMTFKRYDVEQEDWLKAKEVPADLFRYFTTYSKKKPYDVIQRSLTYSNLRQFRQK